MAVEIKVPALGESATEATVAKWLVRVGDTVTIDQPLCELETDKVTVEVNASVAGGIADLAVVEGATIQVGAEPSQGIRGSDRSDEVIIGAHQWSGALQ